MATTTQTSGVTLNAKVNGAAEFAKLAKENERLQKASAKNAEHIDKLKGKLDAAAKSSKGAGNAFSESISGFATGANQAMELVGKIDEWSARSVKIAGVSANFTGNIDKMRAATRGLVTDFDLMRLSNQAMSLGVAKTPQDMEALAAAADKLAAKMGVDVTSAMESLLAGVGRGSTEMLDNLGIILKQESAQERYAAALGKTRDQLTSQEKSEAFRIEAMKAITKAAGEVKQGANDASVSFAQLATTIKNAADNALLLPGHIKDLMVELGVVERHMEGITKQANTQNNIEAELQRLHRDRMGFAGQYALSVGDIFGLKVATLDVERNEKQYIDRIRLHSEQRRFEEQKTNIELEKQVQTLQAGVMPAMSEVLYKASRLKSEYMQIGAPMHLHTLAILGIGKGIKEVVDYTEDWDWSLKKTKKTTQDFWKELGIKHEERDVLFSIEVQNAERVVAHRERELEIAEAEFKIENARRALKGQDAKITSPAVTRAQMDLDVARMNLAAQSQTLEKQFELEESQRHEAKLRRLDEQMAREQAAAEAHERMAQRRRENEETIVEASKSSISSLAGLSTARKKDALTATKISQAAASADLMIDGYQYAAKSAAAFAALRPVQGAAFAVASGLAFAKAVEIGTRPINLEGNGKSSDASTARGGRAANMPRAGGSGNQGPPSSEIPGSGGGLNRPQAGDASGVYNITVLGAIDDTSAEKIMQGIEKLKRTRRVAA